MLKVELLNKKWWEIPFQRATLAGRGPRPVSYTHLNRKLF